MKPAISLEAMRLDQGLNIPEAAAKIGIGEMTLRRAERGTKLPYPRNRKKIADYYGYRVTEIWRVEDDEREAA